MTILPTKRGLVTDQYLASIVGAYEGWLVPDEILQRHVIKSFQVLERFLDLCILMDKRGGTYIYPRVPRVEIWSCSYVEVDLGSQVFFCLCFLLLALFLALALGLLRDTPFHIFLAHELQPFHIFLAPAPGISFMRTESQNGQEDENRSNLESHLSVVLLASVYACVDVNMCGCVSMV